MTPTNALARKALGMPEIAPVPGDPLARPSPIPKDRSHARSDFIDRLPGIKFVPAWWTSIALANPTIAAGSSAWFKFGSLRVPSHFGQMVGLVGFNITLLPTDPDGAGDEGEASPIAWGTARGHGAAIVIGIDLPGAFQTWSSGPANIPGVEPSGLSVLSDERPPEYIDIYSFPPGKLNDTTPPKLYKERSFKPYIHRFAQGERLDVALVVRRAQITGKTGKIWGGVTVNFDLGLTRDRVSFGGA